MDFNLGFDVLACFVWWIWPMNQYKMSLLVLFGCPGSVRLSAAVCCETCDAIPRIVTATCKVYGWFPVDALRCLWRLLLQNRPWGEFLSWHLRRVCLCSCEYTFSYTIPFFQKFKWFKSIDALYIKHWKLVY